MELLKKLERSNSKYLVYTSAGDHSSIKYCIKGDKKFGKRLKKTREVYHLRIVSTRSGETINYNLQ